MSDNTNTSTNPEGTTPMTNNSHQLIASGAAFDDDGERLFSKTTSGMGRALCSCGWMSDPAEYGRTRKKLHADHKAAQDDDYVTEEVAKLFEEIFEETAEETVAPKDSPESPEELAEETVEAPEPEEEEKGGEQAFPVPWPRSVARLFWRALAKDGADILAQSVGAQRKSNESKGELLIIGPAVVAMDLAEWLPTVFISAEASLKQWRKTSPEYKRHDLKTADGRRTAFAEEQNFLRAFCSAVAGDENADAHHSAGHQAGVAFSEIGGLL